MPEVQSRDQLIRIERQMGQYIHADRIVFHEHQAAVGSSGEARRSHDSQAAAYSRRWAALSALFSWARDRLQHNQEYDDAAVLTRKNQHVYNYIN